MIFRRLIYPVLVFGIMALYYLAVPVAGKPVQATIIQLSALATTLVLLLELAVPYRREWSKFNVEYVVDFLFTNILLPAVTITLGIALANLMRTQTETWLYSNQVTVAYRNFGFFTQVLIGLLVCEFTYYWIHRWSHKNQLLWRFHIVHHSLKRVYWNNAGRFHIVDMIITTVVYFAPLYLLRAPHSVLGAVLLINSVTGLLEHANINFEAGFLNRFFNTAQLHRWHHSLDAKVASHNFGKVLSIYDQIFGTRHYPVGEQVGEVGAVNRSNANA